MPARIAAVPSSSPASAPPDDDAGLGAGGPRDDLARLVLQLVQDDVRAGRLAHRVEHLGPDQRAAQARVRAAGVDESA